MDRVLLDVVEALRRADVVRQTANGLLVTGHVVVLPFSEQADDEVAAEALRQDLCEEVHIADEGSLKNNRNVRGVEELDGERLLDATLLLRLQVNDNLEILLNRHGMSVTYLEVDDDEHNKYCRQQVAEIRRTLPLEGLGDGVERV